MDCLAAVSGGPDSMALLFFLEQKGLDYGVCHVNYHRRQSAARDEAIVRSWCQKHCVPLLVLHPQYAGGNFQGWAREVRYAFFSAAARAWNVRDIYLGHHMDDSIETWMLQKKRGALCDHYGLVFKVPWQNLRLIRPLLGFEKKDLAALCKRQGIEYGVDESNLSDAYARNRIRRRIIEPADSAQKRQWLQEMETDQKQMDRLKQQIRKLADTPVSTWLNHQLRALVLDHLIFSRTGCHLSKASLEDACIKLAEGHVVRLNSETIALQCHHQRLLYGRPPAAPFWIGSMEQLEQLCRDRFVYASFRLSTQGKRVESFNVAADDFPLLIRSAARADAVVMRYGTRKIARLHIDRHIPKIERGEYPVIEGRNGVFFALLAGADPSHYVENATFFMLKWSV